ncbi:MAG: hypothetical protein M0P71_12310 [Melioribacteraceae bacterium]|jgi:hypothetical protein|nr:hypothetical protein [Melioribacteraceae bacterium]
MEEREHASIENNEKLLKVICVLTGSRYSFDYLYKLKSTVERNIKIPFEFICYTDNQELLAKSDLKTKETIKVGWWGKVDIFKETGPCLFLDLDTIVVTDITEFAKTIFELPSDTIRMIFPFKSRKEGWASGLMVWNGDFKFVFEQFDNKYIDTYRWDQRYISFVVNKNNRKIFPIQQVVNICSYKYHCQRNIPEKVNIICFHGIPRPHQVQNNWMEEHWK